MAKPITQKMLIDWGGPQVLQDAKAMVKNGQVLEAAYDPPFVRGAVLWNNRHLKTSLKVLPDGSAESHCPCYMNRERGVICPHVIAVGLTLVLRATDPEREAKYQAELRHASRMARVDDDAYLKRVPTSAPGAIPARLHVVLDRDWTDACREQEYIPLSCHVTYRREARPVDKVPGGLPLTFNKQDESLLFVLEDIAQGPIPGSMAVKKRDFTSILRLHAGRPLACQDGREFAVNKTRMTTLLRMDVDRENGELILIAHTELPFMKEGEFPVYIVAGREGWVFGADNFWPLTALLPLPYHSIYEHPIVLPRRDVLRFLDHELHVLAKTLAVETDISPDLFTRDPATPVFRLLVRGSPASLSAILYAEYDDITLTAGKPDARGRFAIPDPEDIMRYTVRNLPAEARALDLLSRAGFEGDRGDRLEGIVGKRQVLNVLASSIPALRRRGWRVDVEGRVAEFLEGLDFATPVVHISDHASEGWFDVGFTYEDGTGATLSPVDIQTALRKGDAFLSRQGKTVLLDADAVNAMHDVFSDCATADAERAGHFRMAEVYAGFVKSSLDALDGIDVEESPDWRQRAAAANRTVSVKPVKLSPPLDTQLRPYQKDGVAWLHFLEYNGFCGLLADEMGLGKTIQALAWLSTAKRDGRMTGPSLVVCPTSLVENWADEAARFAPELSILLLTGAQRHEKWPALPSSDLALTSYALLRRDLDRLLEIDFFTAILDEAQHIKNRSTRNALAAKQIKARHRLVLTGTPLENSVSDLWSIMDFLMPGYLGSHVTFKANYEAPILQGGPHAEVAQTKLRRKLQPFMVRRRKDEVAKELPPKIERVSFCHLTPDQAMVYKELLESSRRRIHTMVSRNGLGKSRMQILAVLMRLRQVCCHLDLLKLPDLKTDQPSSKMDVFTELLDEALDSGHRILVFSQFVSMLKIISAHLDRAGFPYCYLDGSTKNRMDVVKQFNRDRNIPLFLISLKAGGTGLNLTGADMVVHFDPWWNPAVENQATDRAYRIGQKRTVYCVKLITRDTVEEKVLALQEKKRHVIDATIETDRRMVQKLSWEDIQELLTL